MQLKQQKRDIAAERIYFKCTLVSFYPFTLGIIHFYDRLYMNILGLVKPLTE